MERAKPRVLVFASGDKEGGGSGFQEMVECNRTEPPILDVEIAGVVTNHANGGVRKRAEELFIPWNFFTGPFTADGYRGRLKVFSAEWVMLSGWLKLVKGLKPAKTVNIHPGPLPLTRGLYGHFVHEAVMEAYSKSEITQSVVTMHFVTEEYDRGPIICEFPILIRADDTPETLGKRVNEVERVMQSRILNLVVHGHIELLSNGTVRYNHRAERAISAMGGKPRLQLPTVVS